MSRSSTRARLAAFANLIGVGLAGCHGAPYTFPPDGGDWPARPTPAWSSQPRLAITDDGEDTLAFVSEDAPPALLGFFPVGFDPVRIEAPHHLAASPDGQSLYVNLSEFAPGSASGPSGAVDLGDMPGLLVKVRASDGATLGAATMDKDPGDVIVTRDGTTAYVSHYDLLKLQAQLKAGQPAACGYSTVGVVDTATMGAPSLFPVCATAHGMALGADESTLYVACSLADEIAVVDLATHAVTHVPVGPAGGPLGQPSYFPYAVARAPADGSIWISCNGGSGSEGWSGLRVYDPAKHAMDDARAVPLTGIAMFGDFLPDGKTLVVPHQGDDQVSLVDTSSSTEIAVIAPPPEACLRAHMVKVDPAGHRAFLVCEGDHVSRKGTLVTLDLDARAVVGFATVGLYSDGVVELPPASP